MTLLVSLDEAKLHLNMDHDADDELITLYIHAVSGAVINYLGDVSFDFVDTGGNLVSDTNDASDGPIPNVVRQATLLLVGDFYRNREPTPADAVDPKFGYGYLPRAVVALLYPLRDPTIA